MKRDRSKQPDTRRPDNNKHGVVRRGGPPRRPVAPVVVPPLVKSIPVSTAPGPKVDESAPLVTHWDMGVTHGNRYVAVSQVFCFAFFPFFLISRAQVRDRPEALAKLAPRPLGEELT
jgi:hypothetical protein